MALMKTKKTHTGGCQCGALRFRVEEPLQPGEICHCRMCQKAFGNFGALLVSVDLARFAWTRGTPSTFRSSALVERGFCQNCGTPLFIQDDGGTILDLAIGAFDHPEVVTVVEQIGIESRLPAFAELAHLPERKTSDTRTKAEMEKLKSLQHPDYET